MHGDTSALLSSCSMGNVQRHVLVTRLYHIHGYYRNSSSAGAQADVSSLYQAVSDMLPAASRVLIENGKSIYSVVSLFVLRVAHSSMLCKMSVIC